MANLNRVTRGLLSLLDAQTQGQNPSQVSETIIPTLDMGNFLYSSKGFAIEQAAIVATPALGAFFSGFDASGVLFKVPNDEIWHVRHASIQVLNNDAALAISGLRIQLAILQGGFRMALTAGRAAETVVANATMSSSVHFAEPLVLMPGALPGYITESFAVYAGVDPTVTIGLYMVRLKI